MENWRNWMNDDDMKLRQETLGILLKKFPNTNMKSIYECADDWCKKFKTTSGLVKYYKTYYNTAK